MAVDLQRSQSISHIDYGEVEKDLPEFTDGEQSLREVELSFDDLLAKNSKSIETLRGLKGSFALSHIDELIFKYVMTVVSTLEFSATGEGDVSESITHPHIEAALRDRTWTGVEKYSSEGFAITELLVKANELKFMLIKHWIENAEDTELGRVAETEFLHVLPAMAATDKWFLKMIVRHTPIPVAERKQNGFTNPFSVLAERDGEPVEIPFCEAFPDEIQEITDAYSALIVSLESMREDKSASADVIDLCDRKIAYYTALIAALYSDDKALWYEADALLPGQISTPSDVIHIHSIEEAYGKDQIVRTPETSLRVPDKSADAVKAQELANQTKVRMLRSLGSAHLKDLPAVVQTISLAERSNAVMRHFLGTGFEHFLKPAGQILPNRVEPRTKGGVDSSLDISSTDRRWRQKEDAVRAVFGQKFFDDVVLSKKNIHHEIGVETASHELGHSVGILEDTLQRLGGVDFVGSFIEEWKATVGGVVASLVIPLLDGTDEVTIEDAKGWIISKLAMSCRYAMLRHDSGGVMYFRKSMMLVNLMQKHNLLVSTGEGEFPWEIRLEDENVLAFLNELLEQYKQVLTLYGEGTEDQLREFLGANLTSSPFLEFVCKQIKVAEQEKHTPEKVSTLPSLANPDVASIADVTGETREGLADAVGTPE